LTVWHDRVVDAETRAGHGSIAEIVAGLARHPLPVRVEAYDGSVAGAADAGLTVRIARRAALRRVLTRPGELGLARAYVAGDLELDGRVYDAFLISPAPNRVLRALRTAAGLARRAGPSVLVPIAPPAIETAPMGRLHSRGRDRRSVTYHYDVSNAFYELVLGPSMVYSCAVFASPDDTLEAAQIRKVDLVCRKLALEPGMRVLDVGCGWGTLAIHAAHTYGCRVVGVTLSVRQRELAEARAREAGVDGLVEFRVQDYRDVDDGPYDAVCSIGMAEHVGRRALDAYARQLFALVRPGGRVLHHAIGRPGVLEGAATIGPKARRHARDPARIRSPFISRYVFPDGELHEVGATVSRLQAHGFEVRHLESLREHYALTLRRWVANLEANLDAAEAEVGPERARVWRLYMAGSAVGFERHRLEVHQALCARPDAGRSRFPLRPQFEASGDAGWQASAARRAGSDGQPVRSPRT